MLLHYGKLWHHTLVDDSDTRQYPDFHHANSHPDNDMASQLSNNSDQ